MRWETSTLSLRVRQLLSTCLVLAGLVFSAPGSGQVIAQGGQLQVLIYDGGGEVELLPLGGGIPATTCTIAGGADCEVIGIAGEEIQLTALPQSGWGFIEWWVDGVPSTLSPLVEPLPFGGTTFVDAYFGPILSVTVNGSGQGAVSSDDSAINCSTGQSCQHTYSRSYTSPILLTAVAGPDSEFVGWNQPGGGNACADPMANVCELTAYGTGFGALPNGVTATFNLLDDDGDGIGNSNDICPNTPAGETADSAGCSPSQLDDDGDNVNNAIDQCPNTPTGEAVDANGCAASQTDTDDDGVSDAVDQCPNTPFDETPDSVGCSPSQLDDDGDNVNNAIDQCPNTPTGEAVDADGCALAQLDTDGDGVADDADLCPMTPAGAEVDLEGCAASQVFSLDIQFLGSGSGFVFDANNPSETCSSDCTVIVHEGTSETIGAEPGSGSIFVGWGGLCGGVASTQCTFPVSPGSSGTVTVEFDLDSDGDGVGDGLDQCPNTALGDSVDGVGCSVGQQDADSDGVSDAADQCPATPLGETVDASGCSASQLDSDGDGIDDSLDQCPATPTGETVDSTGCPIETVGDADGDGVNDDVDQCPDTPPGAEVDDAGCTLSLPINEVLDRDGDGVAFTADQCPDTPAEEEVDEAGCSASQRDGDGDGVNDASDSCPNTSSGATVDSSGCSEDDTEEQDSDGDTVIDSDDQCPQTAEGSPVDPDGCADEQKDDDGDGVNNAIDQCPDTAQGESVDETGCPQEGQDEDGDGVEDGADQCPETPAGDPVDTEGCADYQRDDDGDTVTNGLDQCPDTPANAVVDSTGCAESQKDSDGDSVSDGQDSCPNTAAGESVDEQGCSDSQRDSDGDGIADSEDSCPATNTIGEVDGNGCAADERDTDNDGIVDSADECPDSDSGLVTNAAGCSTSQIDSDGDGITDDQDQCPETGTGQVVTGTGCTSVEEEIGDFGEELSELDGLSGSESQVASTIDEMCPRLILADEQGQLTSDQQDLRAACSSLKNKSSSTDQQAEALAAITPEQVSNRTDIALDTGGNQMRQISQRLLRVRSGDARGLSLSGLTLNFDDQAVSGSVIDEAIDTVTDEQSAFQDFGRWGVFVQGDVDVLDRDSSDSRASYESDSWLVTTGVDYRFDNNWYAGVAINYGETDTDYRDASSAVETMGVSVYGGWIFSERGFIDFLIGYLDDDYDLTRRVAYSDSSGNFDALYGASTGGNQLTGGFNFGWMWNQGGWRFGPTASVSFIDGKVNGYQESALGGDSAAWALRVEETAYSQWSLRLGAQLDYAWLTDFGVIIPGVIANYVAETSREADDTSAMFANDVSGLGDAFTISRDFRDSRYYDVTFNLAGQFSYGISAYGSYRITGGRRGVSHSGYTLGLRWDQAF